MKQTTIIYEPKIEMPAHMHEAFIRRLALLNVSEAQFFETSFYAFFNPDKGEEQIITDCDKLETEQEVQERMNSQYEQVTEEALDNTPDVVIGKIK